MLATLHKENSQLRLQAMKAKQNEENKILAYEQNLRRNIAKSKKEILEKVAQHERFEVYVKRQAIINYNKQSFTRKKSIESLMHRSESKQRLLNAQERKQHLVFTRQKDLVNKLV